MEEKTFNVFTDTSEGYESYTSISGELDIMTNSTGDSDQLGEKTVGLRVPKGKVANLSASLHVDDWGYLDIQATGGNTWNNRNKMRLIDLTSEREEAGPRGGHPKWGDDGGLTLPAGDYNIVICQTNQPYNAEYEDVADNNRSFCSVNITIAYTAAATLKTLSADEYGEIPATGTNCKGYIKSGDKVVNGHHAISVGLEYSGSYPDESFDGTPSSSIPTDNFKPSSVSLQENGKSRFKVWTAADCSNSSEISLNGAKSDQVHFLPAVFEDRFEVTVYYTCMEKSFTGDVTTNVTCYVEDSNTQYVVVPSIVSSFMKQVSMEGFGELASPIVYKGESYSYLAKFNSKWRIYQHVLGNSNNTLKDKISCAVDPSVIALGSRIKIMLGEQELAAFDNNDTFVASDKGSAIKGNHIDLYWGSDAPSPNSSSIPAGLPGGLKSRQSYRVILLSE